MRKIFRYALTGFVAASFSQIALSQSAGADTKTDAAVSPNTSSSAQGQTANPDDKERKGKGYAKGHERGKGHGVNDERHGGRHSSGDSASSGASSSTNQANQNQNSGQEKKY